MAISSPSAPSFSICCNNNDYSTTPSRRSFNFSPIQTTRRLFNLSCQLNNSSSSNGFDGDGDLRHELQHGVSTHQRRRGSPVFVTLPVDSLSFPAGMMKRKKAMAQSFRALTAAGVEGVVMEVWWGLVEKELPRVYNWQGYLEIVVLAKRCGLKVRAVMAFHQCGTGPDDPFWIPLPQWVCEEMDKDPDLAYSDRFGRRNMEYISLGCDVLPVLHGRSPIQAYAEFMRSFRDTFIPFLGGVITGIQVGMGPAGELRYPSCPIQKLAWTWRSRELGEFQCYDKYMLASLNACAGEIGMREWANGGPIGASNLMQDPESTQFFRSDGSWNTPYGEFFLAWYSGMLLLHGERICREAETIFRGLEVNLSGKVAGIHWHYGTRSHPSELTAGYYNTSIRDGLLPIARVFGRYGFTMSCTCFEMQDAEEQQMNPVSSPEGFVKQLLLAARICDIPLQGENSASTLDDGSFQQVLRMSKFYSDGPGTPTFSFNFVRMDKNLFEYRNWVSFTRFVRQMSDVKSFRAKLGFGEGDMPLSSLSASATAGAVLAY
ncbi:beta-amylase 1, chloroplastic-like isoform X1 [Lycium barbarum]|uniref:beta-amylase 1, chloroplastic-like isoform X1 n=1 Tax=Lycium barbarum TaxID=112863 RepID=UPI00293E4CF7|nr:beta-amylase 1, chloroplastic-like isoform X1 [Lycium barbarum]